MNVTGGLIGDLAVPNSDVTIIVDHEHAMFKLIDGQWHQKVKIGAPVFNEDVEIKLFDRQMWHLKRAMHNIENLRNVGGHFPRKSNGVCEVCGGKSEYTLHSYQSGCTNMHRFKLCITCLFEGSVIKPSKAKRCRICGKPGPDKNILSRKGTSTRSPWGFNINVHASCVHSISQYIVAPPQWVKFEHNVSLI